MEDNPSELVTSNQQSQNQNSGQFVSCNICQRGFKTNRGLLQHLSFCRKRNRENNINFNTAINGSNNIAATNDKSDSHDSNGNGGYETYFWNDVRGTLFEKDLNDAYEKIIRKDRTLETRLVYDAKWCSGEKAYRRNNSSFETLDSRLAIDINCT